MKQILAHLMREQVRPVDSTASLEKPINPMYLQSDRRAITRHASDSVVVALLSQN
jgi:hypothetical protein